MDRSAHLAELIDDGVSTLKIEGRLKDADYVTNVTAYYRELLDALGTGKGHIYHRRFVPNPEKTFHRGGIDYFLHGRTPHMANWKTPKSTGEYIGQVVEARGHILRIRLKEGVTLHNGDGLSVGNEGFNVNGIDGEFIRSNKTILLHHGTKDLYRNLDIEFSKSIHSERQIPVDIVFSETEEGFCIRIGDKEQVFVYPKEPAKNEEKALNSIKTQLAKLGDTIYVAREVKVESRPYFIPISVLNEWRREVVKDL
jgi:putative protease